MGSLCVAVVVVGVWRARPQQTKTVLRCTLYQLYSRPTRGAALLGLLVQRAARQHEVGDIGNVHPHTEAAPWQLLHCKRVGVWEESEGGGINGSVVLASRFAALL